MIVRYREIGIKIGGWGWGGILNLILVKIIRRDIISNR